MSNIIIAAHEAFASACGIVQEGISRKEWAHPMLAELDAKRVSSYREDLELLERVAKKSEDKKVIKENLKDFEALIRQANRNVQRANLPA